MNDTSSEWVVNGNGIDAIHGTYLAVPTVEEIVAMARSEKLTPEDEDYWLLNQKVQSWQGASLTGLQQTDKVELSDAGWGVIFASDDTQAPEVREALAPLLKFRRNKVGKDAPYYREYIGDQGYQAGESKTEFLKRVGATQGPADPKAGLPFYILIVGDPQRIPFEFQYQLGLHCAVGRICFGQYQEGVFVHEIGDYANYAKSVIAAESGTMVRPRQITFFGVDHPDEQPTTRSLEHLVRPLAENIYHHQIREVVQAKLRRSWSVEEYLQKAGEIHTLVEEHLATMTDEDHRKLAKDPLWCAIDTCFGEEATRERLGRLLGLSEPPMLLFASAHGMAFPQGHQLQHRHQGAILCHNWPGPREWQRTAQETHVPHIPERFYFAADDIDEEARLGGMIAFFSTSYSAGTPGQGDACIPFADSGTVAPHPFVARLPQKMLACSRGGALAVVGYLDRAWGYALAGEHANEQRDLLEQAITLLFQGKPLGYALEHFTVRAAELVLELSGVLQDDTPADAGTEAQETGAQIATLWSLAHDARNLMIVGDPAVRLPLGRGIVTPKERLGTSSDVVASLRPSSAEDAFVPATRSVPATPESETDTEKSE